MDHIRILKRAFHITWNYKVLWIFGFLLALTTTGGGNGGGQNGVQYNLDGNEGFFNPPNDFQWPGMTPQLETGIIGLIIGLVCLAFLLAIVFTIIRYVSEAAIVRLADRYESSGEKLGFRQGWRLGWSRQAFTLFLVDLLVGIVAVGVFFLLLLLTASPLLLWLTQNDIASIIGTVLAVGMFVLLIFLFILIAIAISLVMQFVKRAVVLENLGVIASIRRGLEIVRRRLGDAVIMGLLMFAVGLAVTILTIPVILLLLFAGLVLGGLPGLLVGYLVSLVAEGGLPLFLGILVGLPIFLVVTVIPGLFVSGIYQTYKWNVWTLTYREMVALESSSGVGVFEAKPAPEPPAVDEIPEPPQEE